MRIGGLQQDLASELSGVKTTVPEGSALYDTAAAILVMVRAYENDSRTFSDRNDPVNALAACAYGYGWLHFGISYGILESSAPHACPFSDTCERLAGGFAEKLHEKTARYQNLLDTARSSVTSAPDHSTPLFRYAERVLFIAGVYADQGSLLMRGGSREDALTCFSYGHGWLDAGVTAGLFIIHAERDIFTV